MKRMFGVAAIGLVPAVAATLRWAAAGQHAKAVMAGLAAVAGEPLRESAHRALIKAFLAENGVTNFDQYRVDPSKDLMPDFFVPEGPLPPGVTLKAKS